MSFFAEIASKLSITETKLSSGYQTINFNGEALYVEGFKKINSLSDTEILLGLKKGALKITGQNLTVFSLEPNTIIIKGEIKTCGEEE